MVEGVDRSSRPYESSLPHPDLRTCCIRFRLWLCNGGCGWGRPPTNQMQAPHVTSSDFNWLVIVIFSPPTYHQRKPKETRSASIQERHHRHSPRCSSLSKDSEPNVPSHQSMVHFSRDDVSCIRNVTRNLTLPEKRLRLDSRNGDGCATDVPHVSRQTSLFPRVR